MFGDEGSIIAHQGALATAAVVCAVAAIAILVWYLIKQPPLGRGVRTVLLFGFGVMPIGAAFTGNIAGFEHTKARAFCGSCHVMEPYTGDSATATSETLASRHARNPFFGGENCYVCHADYGMYGTVVTKMAGMKHVWFYYSEWNQYDIEEALDRIHIAKPYPNENCMQCHSSQTTNWNAVQEHAALLEELRDNKVSCASDGCHGPAHPFSKNRPGKAHSALSHGGGQ